MDELTQRMNAVRIEHMLGNISDERYRRLIGDVLEKIREGLLSEAMLSKKQYPSLQGIRTILTSLADIDPRARSAKPEDFVDMSFVRELDQSGYIDRLYGSAVK